RPCAASGVVCAAPLWVGVWAAGAWPAPAGAGVCAMVTRPVARTIRMAATRSPVRCRSMTLFICVLVRMGSDPGRRHDRGQTPDVQLRTFQRLAEVGDDPLSAARQ